MDQDLMSELLESLMADCELPPAARSRCNTWPRRRTTDSHSDLIPSTPSPGRTSGDGVLPLVSEEELLDDDPLLTVDVLVRSSPEASAALPTQRALTSLSTTQSSRAGCVSPKTFASKSSSRRNPWGNMSYADLISQAILSSPEQRLTLAQIYEWLVKNIAYFKERSDSTSSIGWKNSIRHNLSLHSKFVRVQNEGSGKSSWWTLNPDAPKQSCNSGKHVRRRANTLESASIQTIRPGCRRGRGRRRDSSCSISRVIANRRLSEQRGIDRTSSSSSLSPSSFRTRALSEYSVGLSSQDEPSQPESKVSEPMDMDLDLAQLLNHCERQQQLQERQPPTQQQPQPQPPPPPALVGLRHKIKILEQRDDINVYSREVADSANPRSHNFLPLTNYGHAFSLVPLEQTSAIPNVSQDDTGNSAFIDELLKTTFPNEADLHYASSGVPSNGKYPFSQQMQPQPMPPPLPQQQQQQAAPTSAPYDGSVPLMAINTSLCSSSPDASANSFLQYQTGSSASPSPLTLSSF